MSVVKSSSADGYVRRPPPDICFFLVHGTDEGLVNERSHLLVHTLLGGDADPLRLVRLDGDALARNPGALSDEAYAVSMFGGSRAIWIDAQGRDLAPALEPLLARPPDDCAIVVKAGQLRRGHALRAAFEKTPAAVSIECYPDDDRALERLIDRELHDAGLSVGSDARATLVEHLGADRQTTRAEIEKLILYVQGRSEIGLADVQAIVSDAAPSPLDALVDRALIGDLAGAAASAARFFSEGGDGGELTSRLVTRITTLYRVRLEIEAGRGFDAAYEGLFLKGPLDARQALAKAAQRWTSDAIARELPQIRSVAARVRARPRLAEALASRALYALAARRLPGR
jgi:DNA polymerase-3 subunit delta